MVCRQYKQSCGERGTSKYDLRSFLDSQWQCFHCLTGNHKPSLHPNPLPPPPKPQSPHLAHSSGSCQTVCFSLGPGVKSKMLISPGHISGRPFSHRQGPGWLLLGETLVIMKIASFIFQISGSMCLLKAWERISCLLFPWCFCCAPVLPPCLKGHPWVKYCSCGGVSVCLSVCVRTRVQYEVTVKWALPCRKRTLEWLTICGQCEEQLPG